MTPPTPLFSSHLGGSSILTLDEPGKAKPGAARSVFDLALGAGLREVTLVDDKIDGLIAAFKASVKAHVKLSFGIKMVVCSSMSDKTPESRSSESKLVIFTLNDAGRRDLVRLYSRAWTEGHFTHRHDAYGRIDWPTLSKLWTPNLTFVLPFFSSFVARNLLTVSTIVPTLPSTSFSVFREQESQLPFAPLISDALTSYITKARADGATVLEVPAKSVYYPTMASFKAYQIKRCIGNRSTYEEPNLSHMSSNRFSFEAYHQLAGVSS